MRNIFLLAILCSHISVSQQLGDAGWVFDESKYDGRFSEMREYAKAGVEGGIPYREDTPIIRTLSVNAGDEDMSDNIQQAINEVAAQGGGVVLLNNGIYPIRNKIIMKSGVILRGQNRDNVVLNIFIRYRGTSSAIKTETILMQSITNSGLEDFTMDYNVQYNGEKMFPLDKDWKFTFWSAWGLRSQNYENERVYHDRENYGYHDVSNLYVDYIWMKESKNCWMDNCRLLNCGSNPIFIGSGSHITIRNCHIEGAFNKGGNGNGYMNCYGKYVLITKNTIKKLRHLAIQHGAKYCVVYDNHIEVDVNFHQKDEGHNLVENNRIYIPHFHPWRVFQAGASIHGDPGERNMFYNNDCTRGDPIYTDDKIYTFIGKDIRVLSATPPTGAKLYAIIHQSQIDTDGDGVFDDVDACPDTPSGESVDARGCSINLYVEDVIYTKVLVYPNPLINVINIKGLPSGKTDYRLLNARGQTLKKGTLATGENKLYISSLTRGIYFLNIKTSRGNFTKKVVKK